MIIKVRLAHGLGINPSPLCPSVVMGQPLPLFRLYLVFSNKQYNFYNKSMRKMPIQNTAQGFKPTTSRTWVITNTTRPGLPPSSLYYLPGFSFIDTTFSCKGYFWKMFFRLSLLRRQKVFRNCNYFNFLPHLHHFCKQNTFISNRVTHCWTVAQYFLPAKRSSLPWGGSEMWQCCQSLLPFVIAGDRVGNQDTKTIKNKVPCHCI